MTGGGSDSPAPLCKLQSVSLCVWWCKFVGKVWERKILFCMSVRRLKCIHLGMFGGAGQKDNSDGLTRQRRKIPPLSCVQHVGGFSLALEIVHITFFSAVSLSPVWDEVCLNELIHRKCFIHCRIQLGAYENNTFPLFIVFPFYTQTFVIMVEGAFWRRENS